EGAARNAQGEVNRSSVSRPRRPRGTLLDLRRATMSDEQRATFRQMIDGTPEEWMLVGMSAVHFNRKLVDRVLDHFKLLDGDFGGYAVTRLEHSLQTATRAHRDGRDEEYVVCALLHDIGDILLPANHAELA